MAPDACSKPTCPFLYPPPTRCSCPSLPQFHSLVPFGASPSVSPAAAVLPPFPSAFVGFLRLELVSHVYTFFFRLLDPLQARAALCDAPGLFLPSFQLIPGGPFRRPPPLARPRPRYQSPRRFFSFFFRYRLILFLRFISFPFFY